MQSLQITQPGEVCLVKKPLPQIDSDEVLLKVKYIGLCGSDLSSYLGKNPMVKYPVIPGHEIAAEIVDTGAVVPGHLTKGLQVTLNPYTNCGVCPSCKNARVNACQFNQTLGVQRDGALSEFIKAHWTKVLTNDKLSLHELALTEPLSVGFHAISRARVTDTDTVAVLGCGMIGAGAIIRAALRGSRVIAVDIDHEKLKLARKLGAWQTINASTENQHEKLTEYTANEGPDVVVEAAGNPTTYLAAVQEVAFTGRVVCIGYAQSEVSFATKLFVQKEIDILGSRNALPKDIVAVMQYLEQGTCPTQELITKIVKPEETGAALEYWSKHPGKVFKIIVQVS